MKLKKYLIFISFSLLFWGIITENVFSANMSSDSILSIGSADVPPYFCKLNNYTEQECSGTITIGSLPGWDSIAVGEDFTFTIRDSGIDVLTQSHTKIAAASGTTTPGSSAIINFENPIGVTTVEQFFLSLIQNLRNVLALIAILFIVIGGIFYITAGESAERIKTAKNLWVGAIAGLFIALLAPTFLKEIRENFLLEGGVLPSTMDQALTLTEIVTKALKLLLSIIGILAILSLVISGFTYLFALGDSSKAEKAKEMIKWSILGLALAGSAVIIVRQIAVLAS